MDIYLGGNGDISEQLVERTTPNPCIGQVEGFADLARVNPDMISLEERCAGFTPVEKPLTCDQAKCEAGRCLQCDLRLNISNVKLWNEY